MAREGHNVFFLGWLLVSVCVIARCSAFPYTFSYMQPFGGREPSNLGSQFDSQPTNYVSNNGQTTPFSQQPGTTTSGSTNNGMGSGTTTNTNPNPNTNTGTTPFSQPQAPQTYNVQPSNGGSTTPFSQPQSPPNFNYPPTYNFPAGNTPPVVVVGNGNNGNNGNTNNNGNNGGNNGNTNNNGGNNGNTNNNGNNGGNNGNTNNNGNNGNNGNTNNNGNVGNNGNNGNNNINNNGNNNNTSATPGMNGNTPAGLVGARAPATNTNTNSNSNNNNNNMAGRVWCVAKPASDDEVLMANIAYVCGEGGVNCAPIQPGGACFRPNTLVAHASFVMNLYYHRNQRNWWTCHFNNTGLVVFADPSFGECIYPPQ